MNCKYVSATGVTSIAEEADSRIIPHINHAAVILNDTDVVVLLTFFMHQFRQSGLQELWIKFGTGEKTKFIPIHSLAMELGPSISAAVMKAHILTGCDVTSELGTKSPALKCQPEKYLGQFGNEEMLSC